MSYTGRGLRDDAVLPPSVVVDELRECLAVRFPGVEFETRHPLQPFSPRYFAGGSGCVREDPLFSYSEGMRRAAEALRAAAGAGGGRPPLSRASSRGRRTTGSESTSPGSSPSSATRPGTSCAIGSAFASRARKRRSTRTNPSSSTPSSATACVPGSGKAWRPAWDGERSEAILRGGGHLPPRALGHVVHERAWEEMEGLRSSLAPHRATLDAPSLDIDIEVAGFRVEGEIRQAGPEGLLWWRMGALRPRDRIEVRLRQLALASAGHDPASALAVSIAEGSWSTTPLPAPEEAEEELARWLEAWRWGQGEPLPFFPAASWAYAEHIARRGESAAEEARNKAEHAWFGSPYHRGEVEEPYLALVFGEESPVTGAFRELATGLLGPCAGA